MSTPAFNPGQPYDKPAFDPKASYDAAQADDKTDSFWEGLKSVPGAVIHSLAHPVDALTSMGKQVLAGGSTPYGTPLMAPTGNQARDEANQKAMTDAQTEQAQNMAAHPAYTAGQMTGSAALAAAGEALPRLVPALAEGAGRAALLGKTPEAAYESALKPSTTLSQAERAGIVKTGLDNSIPVSKGGLEKIGSRIDDLNQAIKDEISSDPNRPIDPNKVAVSANAAKAKFANQVNAQPDLDAIQNSQDMFLKQQGATNGQPAPDMGAADAQAMKQGTYRILAGKYGEQGSASVEAQKALARGLKEEIATQFPEIGKLNAQESKLLDLQPVLERAVNRISNHQPIGIGTPIVGAGTKAVTGSSGVAAAASILKAVVDNPMVKSRLAIAVSKSSGVPYAQSLARVGAYSAALGATSAGPQASSTADTPTQ